MVAGERGCVGRCFGGVDAWWVFLALSSPFLCWEDLGEFAKPGGGLGRKYGQTKERGSGRQPRCRTRSLAGRVADITHLACCGQSSSSSIPALLISPANGPLKVYALSQATLGNALFLGEESSRLCPSPAWTPRSPALCLAWRGRWSEHQMQQNCCCLSKTALLAL